MFDDKMEAVILAKITDEKVRNEVRVFIGNTWRKGISEGMHLTRAKLTRFFEEVDLDAHFVNWREEVQKSHHF
jgi:hypothetical protein